MKSIYEENMRLALEQAEIGLNLGEVPVGCVIIKDNTVVGKGYNTRESERNALGHAEIMAIDSACKNLKSWRLSNCVLYVTLEPCPMCMGAIINSRIEKVVFGAKDEKAGCCGSVIQLSECGFNHRPKIVSSVCKDECTTLLSDFFKKLRNSNNK